MARQYKFETFTNAAGEHCFACVAGNGEIVFPSEGYKTKAGALRAIKGIKGAVYAAPVVARRDVRPSRKPRPVSKPLNRSEPCSE